MPRQPFLVLLFSLALGLPGMASAAGTAGVLAAESPDDFPPLSTNERVAMVPTHGPERVLLQVTIMTPPGRGPFPLAILNHGSNDRPAQEQERYHRSFGAYYFLSRGYAVAIPMMRGYAGSQGHQIYSHCNQEEVGLANARDIDAVIGYLEAQTFVDPSRVVVAGGSFGGWNTLAYGALSGTMSRPEVKGLVNFVGGAVISNCPMEALSQDLALKHYAQATRLPSLWLYGQNDSKFATSVWHAMFDSYAAAGGKAELADLGKFAPDTHNLLGYPEGMFVWASKVDAFLGRLGLPNHIAYPDYVPSAFPAPTHAARIDDVDAVPWLDDAGRAAYRKFLELPIPRVFFIAPDGWHLTKGGGFDPLASGKRICAAAGKQCVVYAVDDAVTWSGPPLARSEEAAAPLPLPQDVPYLSERGRQAYRQFLKLHQPRAFAIAPDGGYAMAAGGDPSAAALAECGKVHRDCRLYVVGSREVK
ncbi:MAG TPA: prolyl oligopeptidase family serine peptidase [Burkholderiaceae bacterium]